MSDRVWMTHPDLPGQRISTAPSGVGVRQQSGWVLDDSPQGEQAAPVAAPAYVHRILDAYLSGEPLDFGAETVPADVQARLSDVFETVDDVPAGNVDDVLAWVGDNGNRARLALTVEHGRPSPRTTLVSTLEKLAAPAADEE